MDREVRKGILKQVNRTIRSQARCISDCRTRHLTTDFLATINVRVSELDWHPEGAIDFEPRFCRPYPAASFESIFKQTQATNTSADWDYDLKERGSESRRRGTRTKKAEGHLRDILGCPLDDTSLASQGDWLCCGEGRFYKDIGSYKERDSPSSWGTICFFRSMPWPQDELPKDPLELERVKRRNRRQVKPDYTLRLEECIRRPGKKRLVHMGVSMHDDSDVCESRVLRSELLAAIRVMRDQMVQRRNREQHAIFPVFVYSWSAYHVRILQVHYDYGEQKLIVRKTTYIEISGPEQEDEIRLVLRWMLSIPIGSTSWDELDMRNKAPLGDSNSTESPRSPPKKSIPCR